MVKKTTLLFCGLLFVIIIFISLKVSAYEKDCRGDDIVDQCAPITINISLLTAQQQLDFFQCELDNYLKRICNGAYQLNFIITNGTAQLKDSLVFNKNPDKLLIISGLKLKRHATATTDFDLLTININAPIIITSSDIGPNSGGACLIFRGSGHTVKSSKFHDCTEGIQINGDNNFLGASDETTFLTDANIISGNKIGIHWISGILNRFPYNVVYNNIDNGEYKSDYAILIDSVLNRMRPEIVFSDGEKALFCETDDTKKVTARYLKFKPETVVTGQEVILYKTDVMYRQHQAEEFLMKCTIGAGGKCPVTFPSSIVVTETQCGAPDLYAVALVNDSSYTSMLTANLFMIDGPVVSIGTVPPIDITSSNPVTGGGGDTTGGTSSDTPVAVLPGDESGVGTGGAGSGCGASIVPNNSQNTFGTGLGMWWIIFASPLATLCVIRIKKRK
jgi:hypothetical protein